MIGVYEWRGRDREKVTTTTAWVLGKLAWTK